MLPHIDLPLLSFEVLAGISGATAGAIQAIAGAPAENVRILMESGVVHTTSVSGWRHAWKEVFLRTGANGLHSLEPPSKRTKMTSGGGEVNLRSRLASMGFSLDGNGKVQLSDMRETKAFMREVRSMAGRGWDGWGWGCAKDVVGTFLLQVFGLN